MERLAIDKHSGIFCPFGSNKEKKCCECGNLKIS
jgi:hypothetical protein